MLRAIFYLWALPTTSIGLLCLLIGAPFGGVRFRIVDGVLEVHGGLICRALEGWTLLPAGAMAMTLGHVVLGRNQAALDLTRTHERIHVKQCERWGPLFIPAYLGASLLIYFRGGDAYRDNPFEREAFSKS